MQAGHDDHDDDARDAATAWAWIALGMCHRYRGDIPAATSAYAEARAILAANDHLGLASLMHNEANLALLDGRLDDAERLIDEALALRSTLAETAGDLGALAVVQAVRDAWQVFGKRCSP